MALAYEADHVFTNLLRLSDHGAHVPVVVKLGMDALQVASVSHTHVFHNLSDPHSGASRTSRLG